MNRALFGMDFFECLRGVPFLLRLSFLFLSLLFSFFCCEAVGVPLSVKERILFFWVFLFFSRQEKGEEVGDSRFGGEGGKTLVISYL